MSPDPRVSTCILITMCTLLRYCMLQSFPAISSAFVLVDALPWNLLYISRLFFLFTCIENHTFSKPFLSYIYRVLSILWVSSWGTFSRFLFKVGLCFSQVFRFHKGLFFVFWELCLGSSKFSQVLEVPPQELVSVLEVLFIHLSLSLHLLAHWCSGFL